MSPHLETRAVLGAPRWLAGVALALVAWLALAPPGMAGPQGPGVLRAASQARPKTAEPGAGVPDAKRAEEAPKLPDSAPVGLPAGGSTTPATRPNPVPPVTSAEGLPKTGAVAGGSDPAALDEVLRLHSQLAAGARGLAPSPETRLAPDAFQAADQDGDGLLSREEFVVGYHKQLLDSGRSPAADLAAEATRLAALSRARRAMVSRGEAPGEPRPAPDGAGRVAGRVAGQGAGPSERPPMLSVRTLIPATPAAAPVAAPTRVVERGNASGAPPAGAGIDRSAGERAATPARPSDAGPVRPPESSADRRSASPVPGPPLTKPGRSPAGERPVIVAPPAPVPRPPRP